ncbi:MAG TPA: DUF4396 domain-containing protein, partial [Thermoanaerobaculia bacterium]
QNNRVTWHQKNVTRIGTTSDRDTERLALQVAFPRGDPSTIISVGSWQNALAATPLIAQPSRAAVSPAPGSPAQDAAEFAATIDAQSFSNSNNVIVVPSDADPRWALPAAAYSARTGTPILFIERDRVPEATLTALDRRKNRANIYLLAPRSAASEKVIAALRQKGRVHRIAGGDFAEHAVGFAEFRDVESGFGWGRDTRRGSEFVPLNVIAVNSARWEDAIAAAHLARYGTGGPLLYVETNRVPAIVDHFLWRQRPVFNSTPAEGPFHQAWIVGSFDRISYATQAWIDYALEIEQYMTLGDSGVSGFEALTIAWLFLALGSAAWILIVAERRLPDALGIMKLAWSVFGLLFGPVAIALFVHSYDRQPKMERDGMAMWHRSFAGQSISATVMMFGFDMMLIVLAVFLLAYLGFPLIRSGSPIYWMGSSMFLMMVAMYVIALLAMMLLFHTPMTMHEQKLDSYWKAFAAGFPIMLATMSVESLGMMPTMWWAQMRFLPAMQMPTGDDVSMWGTLLMAVFAGFLVALLFNAWLVGREKKMGMM